MRRRGKVRPGLLALLLAAGAACDDTDAGRELEARLVGSYVATSLRTTNAAGVTTEWMTRGATVALRLHVGWNTGGRLILPDPANPVDVRLDGTWRIVNGRVELDHPADSFLRDMPLAVQGTTLVGDGTFGGTRVQVSLRQE